MRSSSSTAPPWPPSPPSPPEPTPTASSSSPPPKPSGPSTAAAMTSPSSTPPPVKSSPPFPSPGKPEFAAVDGKGTVFDNIEDKNEIVRLDAHALKLTATWPAGCDSPCGLAFDAAGHRLFPVCDGNKMSVIDSNTGKLLANPAIGDGPDAAGWDAKHKLAFASSGDGVLSVVDAAAPGLSHHREPAHPARRAHHGLRRRLPTASTSPPPSSVRVPRPLQRTRVPAPPSSPAASPSSSSAAKPLRSRAPSMSVCSTAWMGDARLRHHKSSGHWPGTVESS